MLHRYASNPLWYLITILGMPTNIMLIIGSFYLVNSLWFIGAMSLSMLSYWKPSVALSAFFIFMPVFGNRPCEKQTHYLIFLSSFLLIGLYANLLSSGYPLKRFIARLRTNNILLTLISLYFIASLLSLCGLPLLSILVKSKADHGFVFRELLKVGEVTILTSLTSVLYAIQAMLIGLYIFGTIHRNKLIGQFKIYLFSLVIGLQVSVIAGMLDYFGFISLAFLRNPYPNRLISFFANPTWYAQYLSVVIPLISVLLLSGLRCRVSMALMLLLMVANEATLLFAMERGGWITYPPILLTLWITIYVAKEKFQDKVISNVAILKKNWFKILISLPLTIVVSVFIVYTLKDYRVSHNLSPQDTANAILDRAKTLTNNNDRTKFIEPSLRLWLLNPIYGGGGDSFGWQYLKEFLKPDGIHYNTPDKLLEGQYGTAHNMYLQTLTGKGIFGLFFLVSFLFYLIIKLINKGMLQPLGVHKNDVAESIISIALVGSIIAILIYGNVQEIFYSQPVQIIFWVVVFMGASLIHRCKIEYEERQKKIQSIKRAIIIMLLLLPVHFLYIREVRQYIANSLKTGQLETGFNKLKEAFK